MNALQNFLGVENNHVLIREYEIIGTEFEFYDPVNLGEGGRFIGVRFIKYPHKPHGTKQIRFINIFTLTEYFIHLLEEPVDTATWLRIKQPVTYTIHFDLIVSSYDNDPSYYNSF